MVKNLKIKINKFNAKSFELWKLKMEDLLVDKEQWIMVDQGIAPKIMSAKDWKNLDQKAKITIHLCLLASILLNVSWEAKTKALWDKLGRLCISISPW